MVYSKMKKSKNNNDNNLGMLSHLLGLFTGFIGPLIIFLMLKDSKGTALQNAKNSLNFQISLFIYYIISAILVFLIIGFFVAFSLWVFSVVTIIIGSVKALNGEIYKYPLTIS